MSKCLLFAACLICACSRNDRTSSAPDPRLAPRATAPEVSVVPAPSVSAADITSLEPTAPPRSILSLAASGYPSELRLDSDTVIYCDNRGGRSWNLASGVEADHKHTCSSGTFKERNRACDEIDLVAQVREPGPDDIIDVKVGPSFPVNGHIHDCAFSSGVLLVATGIEVVAIDVKTDRSDVKGKDGGSQVAINGAWTAWVSGKKVFAQRR